MVFLNTSAQADCSLEQEAEGPKEQAHPPHCKDGPAGPSLSGGPDRKDA